MKIHPAADLFPLLQGPEFEALKEDIKANGLRFPILTLADKILDGRNRFNACKAAGVEPRFKALPENTDPLRFVISANLSRRHLSESQRGMIAMKVETMKHGGDRKSDQDANLHLVSRKQAAALLNVSQRTVATARKVQQEAPELAEKIERVLHQVRGVHESNLPHPRPAVRTFPE